MDTIVDRAACLNMETPPSGNRKHEGKACNTHRPMEPMAFSSETKMPVGCHFETSLSSEIIAMGNCRNGQLSRCRGKVRRRWLGKVGSPYWTPANCPDATMGDAHDECEGSGPTEGATRSCKGTLDTEASGGGVETERALGAEADGAAPRPDFPPRCGVSSRAALCNWRAPVSSSTPPAPHQCCAGGEV
jgi:hypothetical protein